MIGKVGGMFLKIKLDGESIMAMMDSTSEKMYLCQVPRFWVKRLSWDRAGDLHEKRVSVQCLRLSQLRTVSI